MKNPFKNMVCYQPQTLLDMGFHSAAKAVRKAKIRGSIIERARQKEGIRIKTAANVIIERCRQINVKNNNIEDFYIELAGTVVNWNEFTTALRRVKHISKEIKKLQMNALKKVENAKHTKQLREIRKEFYGRIAGLIKKNKKPLNLIYEAAKELRNFPDIEDCPTIIIAGFPNVGKSSLLWRLTGSKPEIKPYPFTTKGLMLGFSDIGSKRLQFIDTPGLLDRPFSKRNNIELKAIVALKMLADLIVYIFDVSETCGWKLEKQYKLYKEIKKTFAIPLIPVVNKIDIYGGRCIDEIPVKNIIPVSCEKNEGMEKVKERIMALLQQPL